MRSNIATSDLIAVKIPPNIDRNRENYNRYLAGERAQELADVRPAFPIT